LAELANVTKRTVDYYTNLGLLKAERSPSNYRYYDYSSVERIQFIEDCKAKGMSLDKIKEKIIEKYAEEVDVLELRLKIKDLEKEMTEVLDHLEKNDEEKYKEFKSKLSQDSLSLVKTLLSFIN